MMPEVLIMYLLGQLWYTNSSQTEWCLQALSATIAIVIVLIIMIIIDSNSVCGATNTVVFVSEKVVYPLYYYCMM